MIQVVSAEQAVRQLRMSCMRGDASDNTEPDALEDDRSCQKRTNHVHDVIS
jgi:hypothetical protein